MSASEFQTAPGQAPPATSVFASILMDMMRAAFQQAQGECLAVGGRLDEIFREQGAALARAEHAQRAAASEIDRLNQSNMLLQQEAESHASITAQLNESIRSLQLEHQAYAKALQTSCAQFQWQEQQIEALTQSNASLEDRLALRPAHDGDAALVIEQLRSELGRITRGYEAAHACILDLGEQLRLLRARPAPADVEVNTALPQLQSTLTQIQYPGLNALLDRARGFNASTKVTQSK